MLRCFAVLPREVMADASVFARSDLHEPAYRGTQRVGVFPPKGEEIYSGARAWTACSSGRFGDDAFRHVNIRG